MQILGDTPFFIWMWETAAAILSISIIDLVLSGDNAAVIGMAIRDLPKNLQKKAAVVGTGAAILLRVIFTIFAVYLLSMKYLRAVGGLLLIWITWKLLNTNVVETTHVSGSNRFFRAVGTIIVADLSMAFDNVMGVAGAAHGQIWLVIFGLMLSIPILVFGSTWLAGLMNRQPFVIYLGGMALAHTAISMIIHDNALNIISYTGDFWGILIPWFFAFSVLVYGYYLERFKIKKWVR
ncbi:MAG: TerC family protein [Bacillota bacterium]